MKKHLSNILLVLVDEPMELFSKASNELASAMMRLTQKSRAVGITLILSTQGLKPRAMFEPLLSNIPTFFVLKTDATTARAVSVNRQDAASLRDYADGFFRAIGATSAKRVCVANTTCEELRRVCEHAMQTYGSAKDLPTLSRTSEN